MSASTCPAGEPGEAIADLMREGVAAGVADADVVGVGRAGRFPGVDDRLAEAAGGTLATVAWKGRPVHDPDAAGPLGAEPPYAEPPDAAGPPGAEPPYAEPPDIEPADAEAQVVGVCKAVTFRDAGGAGLEPLVR